MQNDFRVNCHVDNRLWAYMAVRIVHVRPSGKVYNSYPMSGGKVDYTCDIYNFTSKLKGYIEPEKSAHVIDNVKKTSQACFKLV